MRILFDLTLIVAWSDRGVGRYCSQFIKALQATRPSLELDILADDKWSGSDGLNLVRREALAEKPDGHYDFLFLPQYFPYLQAGRPDRLELLLPCHATRSCKAIVGIVFDTIQMVFPDTYLNSEALRSAAVLGSAVARLSAHSFAISEQTKRDLTERCGVAESKVTTIYGGIDEAAWAPRPVAPARQERVVYVGGFEFRKNLDRCVTGFSRFRDEHPDSRLSLSIVCAITEEGRVRLLKLAGRHRLALSIPGYIGQQELVDLVASAKASIFPSLYEGLGLPILESYAVGTPVLGSNTSAMAEIVEPSCQFDPYSEAEIAEAFAKIDGAPELMDRSRRFGAELLKRINWRSAADRTLAVLDRLIDRPRPIRRASDRIAVFTCLPPQASGIANYSAATFPARPESYDVLSDFRSIDDFKAAQRFVAKSGGDARSLYAMDAFAELHEADAYGHALFVLGDSFHNLPALRSVGGVAEHVPRDKCWLYFHDCSLIGLWLAALDNNFDQLLNLFEISYGSGVRRYRSTEELRHSPFLGLLPILQLTGISNILVNSSASVAIVRDEMRGRPARIEVTFLPVRPPPQGNGPLRKSGVPTVGHFGIASEAKGIRKLVAAAREIARDQPIELVLAGWNAASYADAYLRSAERRFVKIIDSPTEEEFAELMQAVDLPVQLREDHFGESSGAVSQLIGHGKVPLVTAGKVDPLLRPWVREVPRGITPGELATEIRAALSERRRSDYAGELGPEAAAETIRKHMLA